MPAFGEVNTPGDQLIWRQLIAKEQDFASKAPRPGFSLRSAVNREEVPVRHKPGHIDPSKPNKKGFDPAAYGWDPQGVLATEFRKCRKQAEAPPTKRFLFPESTAQELGWCMKERKGFEAGGVQPVKSLPTLPPVDEVTAQRRLLRKERKAALAAEEGDKPKRSLGKWASDSQLSATAPGCGPNGTEISMMPPSLISTVLPTELSATSSWPGVQKDLVRRVREQDVKVAEAIVEYNRYLCYGDRGNKHFRPLGETDATAYASAFMKATSGVPPHKWDPRAMPGKEAG